MKKLILFTAVMVLMLSAVSANTNTAEAVAPVTQTSRTAPADITGNTSAPAAFKVTSAARALPESVTGAARAAEPRNLAPSNVNAAAYTAGKIELSWDRKATEHVYYNVYRNIDDGPFEKINKDKISNDEKYTDTEVTTSTSYGYKVEVLGGDGSVYMSPVKKVVSAKMILPKPPSNFKAYQDIENVVLKWMTPAQGSYAVSGYNLYRGKTAGSLKFYKFIKVSETKYDDIEVQPALKYFYNMKAVDVKGNESETTEILSVIPFPRPRTGLTLMPTAYRNNIYDNSGFNVDVSFTYYIGTIFGEHPGLDMPDKSADVFDKIGLSVLTADAKGTVINEFDSWPSLGFGAAFSLLFQDQLGASDPTSFSESINLGDEDSGLIPMYGIFVAASKKLPRDINIHAGYMLSFENGKTQMEFMKYLSQYTRLSGEVDIPDSKSSYYLGIGMPLFDRMGIRIEYIVPWEANSNALLPDYYLINTRIDRFINFDISYLHYPGGYAWLGYISFRFTVFPNPYK